MNRWARITAIAALVVLAALFAGAHRGQLVTLRLGVLTLYRLPLSIAVFGSFLAGMLVMFAAGLQADLRVRRILRERLREEPPPPP